MSFNYLIATTIAISLGSLALSSAQAQESKLPNKAPTQAVNMFNITEEVKIAPGPLLKERKALYARILEAEKNGVGVKNYINALKYVEAMAVKGAPERDISVRVQSISRSLDEQFKRSQILKIQKLPPPIAASSPPPSSQQPVSRRSQFNNKSDIVNKIKDKWFGGAIPDQYKNKLPKGFDPSKLSKQDVDRLMKRLGK